MAVDAMPDAALPDAMPDAAPPSQNHLLLSEVALAGANQEFIEIYNPGTEPVALDSYYLSDDAEYWLLPAAFSQLDPAVQPRPQINADFDFIAKFPDNSVIGPGEVKTVAISYTSFQNEYGTPPDFAFLNTPDQNVAMVDPSGNSGVIMMGATPQLTNSGEAMVLFYWDGESDLVKDVDMLNVGNGLSLSNRLESKANKFADGPDADSELSYYEPETDTANIPELDTNAPVGMSHKRLLPETGYEIQLGLSNGITGDDELSEDLSMTWDNAATLTASTPGVVPASLSTPQ